MDKSTPTLCKVHRPPEAEDWDPRGWGEGDGKKAAGPALWSLCPDPHLLLASWAGEEALRYILLLSQEQQFGVQVWSYSVAPHLSGLGESVP